MTEWAVTIFFNETRGSRFFRFEPEAMLVRGNMYGSTQLAHVVEAETPEGAADRAYIFFNQEGRPNGHSERSLSVGDVIRVKEVKGLDEVESVTYLACDAVGWRRIGRADLKHIQNKADSYACCELAESFACVCMYAHDCPTHASTHIGTHD